MAWQLEILNQAQGGGIKSWGQLTGRLTGIASGTYKNHHRPGKDYTHMGQAGRASTPKPKWATHQLPILDQNGPELPLINKNGHVPRYNLS